MGYSFYFIKLCKKSGKSLIQEICRIKMGKSILHVPTTTGRFVNINNWSRKKFNEIEK